MKKIIVPIVDSVKEAICLNLCQETGKIINGRDKNNNDEEYRVIATTLFGINHHNNEIEFYQNGELVVTFLTQKGQIEKEKREREELKRYLSENWYNMFKNEDGSYF